MLAGDFRLQQWLVQPSLNRLLQSGRTVHLRPKAMDVLVFLAERAGSVVPQEEIMDTVWAREFIGDSALKTAIHELRTALGDDPENPSIIETIVKRGYRLMTPVEREEIPRPTEVGDSPFRLIFGDRQIPLPEGESIIGRAPEALVRIDSTKVSRRHARITVSGGRAVLEDLGSKNGTFVADRRIMGPTELGSGDHVLVGQTVLVFRIVGIAGTTETATGL
jgi:DNA-binding winged helix-turn-helix (wHTH) protein